MEKAQPTTSVSKLQQQKRQSAPSLTESTEVLREALEDSCGADFVIDQMKTLRGSRVFYIPEQSGPERAAWYHTFAKQLRFKPAWALVSATEEWTRTGKHLPTPADLVRLSDEAVARISREVKFRQRTERDEEARPEPTTDQKARVERIVREAGFTRQREQLLDRARMARSKEEAERLNEREYQPHWTEGAGADELEELERARSENPLIRAARKAQQLLEEAER